MIKIFEGNRAYLGRDAATNRVHRAGAAAHANIHAGASRLDQAARVNTPGQPRGTGTYWSEADQVAATTEILNHHLSQIQLRRLDTGDTRLGLEAPLSPGRFKVAEASDDSNLGPNVQGHLGRNNAARAGAGSSHTQGYATRGFVLLVKGVGGLLQVQTSYPIR
jgi:hypothetical protein